MLHRLLPLTLTVLVSGSGCMLSPENGDWINSIFHDVTFNITSLTDGGHYRIESAEMDQNGNVLDWHFLTVGTTDTKLLTDPDGRDIYWDSTKIAVLIGWQHAAGPGAPGCTSSDPKCNSRVRLRALVESPTGPLVPAYTFEDGSFQCELTALGAGGADKVITDCARNEQWVDIYAYGN